MSRLISRGLCAAMAGVALSAICVPALGATGAPTASTQATGSTLYDRTWAGYEAGGGRWFRFISTTVTIPARVIPAASGGSAAITLSQAGTTAPSAAIKVAPGGGPHSVSWVARRHTGGRFSLSPRAGDQLALSLYYDQHGNDYFTAADITQKVTQVVRVAIGTAVYNHARFAVAVAGTVAFPPADVRLWQFSGSHLTTYTGARGSITGPWQTSPLTATVDGTTHSAVTASPSFLWNGGQNFGLWLRAAPTAYVVSQLSGTVTPIDTATGTALPPIPVGAAPDAIAITPDGTTAYVTNQGAGTVTPIDTATRTALPPIDVGSSDGLEMVIAVTPDGKTAYVDMYGRVVPIDTATNTALKAITVPGSTDMAMAITPDGKTVYVASDSNGTVTPIDTATNTALKPITVGTAADSIAISPDSKTAYAAAIGPPTVTPINTATNTALKPIPAGSAPGPLAITPDGKTLYVVDYGSRTVIPIDTATNTALTPIPLGGTSGGPFRIAITPNGQTAYVLMQTSPSVVVPIDTATNTALKPIAISSDWAIAFTPDGKTAYVTSYSVTGAVTPVDTATNTALTPIPVAASPLAIAITP